MLWSSMGEAFRKYAVFGGRSDRGLFERFFMFQVVVGGVLLTVILLAALVAGLTGAVEAHPSTAFLALIGFLSFAAVIYSLVIFLPSTALIIRRLHDTNHSGWWFWGWLLANTVFSVFYFIAIVGLAASRNLEGIEAAQKMSYIVNIPLSVLIYVILYWSAQPGTAGDNRFGPAPVELEPDSPVDGIQVQVSGFFQGVGRAWAQNWRNFGIQGRLSRSEYWCLNAILTPLTILLLVVISVGMLFNWVMLLVGLLLLIPVLWLSVAAGIRRLHDIDYCGWWALVAFILPLGGMAWLYLIFKPSIAGGNRFGPQPMPML